MHHLYPFSKVFPGDPIPYCKRIKSSHLRRTELWRQKLHTIFGKKNPHQLGKKWAQNAPFASILHKFSRIPTCRRGYPPSVQPPPPPPTCGASRRFGYAPAVDPLDPPLTGTRAPSLSSYAASRGHRWRLPVWPRRSEIPCVLQAVGKHPWLRCIGVFESPKCDVNPQSNTRGIGPLVGRTSSNRRNVMHVLAVVLSINYHFSFICQYIFIRFICPFFNISEYNAYILINNENTSLCKWPTLVKTTLCRVRTGWQWWFLSVCQPIQAVTSRRTTTLSVHRSDGTMN